MNTFDRDAARDVLLAEWPMGGVDEVLDALEGCVRPAPQQTIDRDALVRRLEQYAEECGVGEDDPTPGAASDIIALLRPVDGVTLTLDETAVVVDALRDWRGGTDETFHARSALAARLKAGT